MSAAQAPALRPALVMRFDARVKLALALVLGLLTWRAGPAGLALYALGLAWAGAGTAGFLRRNLAAFQGYGLFLVLWMAAKLAMDIWAGQSLAQALAATGLLGARLALVLGLGLVLAQSTSTRELGLATAWYLRPVMGARAWKSALGLALMVHFLPLAWESGSQVRQALRLRAPNLAWRQSALLLPQALLRVLGQKTWKQALALAARGLDREEAWRPDFGINARAWLAGAVVAAAAWAAAAL